MSKGLSQIATAALYLGITVTALSVTLSLGIPALENMQDASAISQAEAFMHELDTNVQEVVAGGEGSTRTIQASFDRGEIYFDNTTEALIYELQTNAEVVSPQSSQRTGNVILSSNAMVEVYNDTVDGEDCYMMENQHVRACIKNIGDPGNPQSLNTSDLLVTYDFIGSGTTESMDAEMNIMLDGIETTSWGDGYVVSDTQGDFIGTGEVTATVYSEYGHTYDIIFSLPTGADFLQVDVQNFR